MVGCGEVVAGRPTNYTNKRAARNAELHGELQA